MNSILRFLLVICVVLGTTSTNSTEEQLSKSKDVEALNDYSANTRYAPDSPDQSELNENIDVDAARSIADSYETENEYGHRDQHEAFKKRAKPLKNIFMGIYKNYKSTYLGNRTSLEYKKKLRDRMSAASPKWQKEDSVDSEEPSELEEQTVTVEIATSPTESTKVEDDVADIEDFSDITYAKEDEEVDSAKLDKKRGRKHKRKNHKAKGSKQTKSHKRPLGGDDPLVDVNDNVFGYNVGPGVNMSLDLNNDIINVNLNGDNLRDIMRGRWLSDTTVQGRGKKYDMVTKVLPLFIIPFLIQSAIVPFLVTKLKLLLMKSILVGKLAIFLLVVSAIKNSNKMQQTYEVAPSYWAGEPSRRSELAAAASSAAYNGYRVEGKPTTWIN